MVTAMIHNHPYYYQKNKVSIWITVGDLYMQGNTAD